jgi:hypothetical protein
MAACPKCGESLESGARVCRHCFSVVDREGWQQQDAGGLGADERGGGHPLEDPPVGPVPITGSQADMFDGLRMFTINKLVRLGRRGREKT